VQAARYVEASPRIVTHWLANTGDVYMAVHNTFVLITYMIQAFINYYGAHVVRGVSRYKDRVPICTVTVMFTDDDAEELSVETPLSTHSYRLQKGCVLVFDRLWH
jgi:hypothetical protein